ncbi:hypothetical protein SK128_007334 [Halocaridina rubra]|uniref:Uncharacterized protein n=1 Tax=Halocaridina rubra TaxID=373956 RepID=A0AAN8ZUG3_HALRR
MVRRSSDRVTPCVTSVCISDMAEVKQRAFGVAGMVGPGKTELLFFSRDKAKRRAQSLANDKKFLELLGEMAHSYWLETLDSLRKKKKKIIPYEREFTFRTCLSRLRSRDEGDDVTESKPITTRLTNSETRQFDFQMY